MTNLESLERRMDALEANMQLVIKSLDQIDKQIALLSFNNRNENSQTRKDYRALEAAVLKMRDDQIEPLLVELRGTEEIFRLELINRLLDKLEQKK